ncbi:PEP-CTERM sorting domain-containing protein [Kamptonema cortianum]|nr:PEP-CTERM sorting domain-containing protein [Geitlerinema splendidum]MDK3156304.1 PEP-CTERM sorting domain-containing protein [Kamptonema cortianum]
MSLKLTKPLLFAAAFSAVAASHAQILFSTGFETSEGYTVGSSAVGVAGWAAGSGSGNSQTVSTDYAASGSNSLKFDNSTLNSFYSIRNTWTASASPLRFSTRVWVTGNNGADRLYGLLLGATPTSTMGGTVFGMTIGGDGVVRAGKTWSSTYSGTGIGTANAGTFSDRWLTFELEIDPGTGDGVARASGFSDSNVITSNFTAVATPQNIQVSTDYNTTAARLGIGYFDDVKVEVVPEPATMMILGAGAAALLARRRRA